MLAPLKGPGTEEEPIPVMHSTPQEDLVTGSLPDLPVVKRKKGKTRKDPRTKGDVKTLKNVEGTTVVLRSKQK